MVTKYVSEVNPIKIDRTIYEDWLAIQFGEEIVQKMLDFYWDVYDDFDGFQKEESEVCFVKSF